MREYLDWQQDRGPVRVRVHRRVLAGLEREGAAEMTGVLLGSVSPSAREVLVEDFLPLGRGGEFDGRSTPAVGYFVAGDLREEDRAFVARHFAGRPHVVLRFELGNDGVRLANVLVEPDGLQPERPAIPGATPKHRVLYRAGEEPADEEPAGEVVEAEREASGLRRFFWPAVAIAAGFLIGGTAYMTLRGDSPRGPAAEARNTAPPKDPMPVPPPTAVAPADAPPKAAPPNEADRTVEPPANRAEVQSGVRASLDRWRASLLSQDIDGHVALYAPSVGPYFTKSRVTRNQIADEVRQMVKRYGPVNQYKISDLTVAPLDANHAIANFRKQWQTAGNKFSGAEREQLRFARQGSEWLITSEQELKVYWVRKK